jgi:two-component system response regulator FixJ
VLHDHHAGLYPIHFHSIAGAPALVTRDKTGRETAPAPPASSRSAASDIKPPAPAQARHRLVHIIGDTEEIRALLGVLTSRRPDTRTQCFASGEAFLDQLATLEQGVVLLDFDLPGISGLDLMTEIRCFPRLFPIIACSDRRSIALAVDAMKLGALDFLEKPHELKSLFAAIEDGFGLIENARAIEQQRIARVSDGEAD